MNIMDILMQTVLLWLEKDASNITAYVVHLFLSPHRKPWLYSLLDA